MIYYVFLYSYLDDRLDSYNIIVLYLDNYTINIGHLKIEN